MFAVVVYYSSLTRTVTGGPTEQQLGHLDVMPVLVLSEGAGPGAQVPSHLTRIPFSLISTSTNYTNKTVKGKVVLKGPLVFLAADNFILKTVIQEEESQPSASSQKLSINVVLFGALAKDFNQAVNQGDVVVASGFTVGKSPTFHKDKLHPCNLLLSEDDSCIYVSRLPPPPDPRSPPAIKRRSALSAEVSRTTKVPKYTYVRLSDLKAGSVVNVYGVVLFFKQPFKSRGTDFCSSLKITDQSNQKICCTVFCEKLDDHPKIFKIGDIVRMHRVKTKFFNDSITLINTFGFSVVTFDGAVGGAVEPRTSSRSFHFDQEDVQIVEELRSWAASQALLPPVPKIPLSAVQPSAYFDLTCQLLAKAPIDTTCTLLRVWDGTRCPHTLLKVIVEPNVTEGPSSFSTVRENLIANILVYDNHVEVARQLKPGAFLRIYNLRAIPGSSKVPGLTSSQSEEVDHLAFHLHGGTAYGRGIRVLPENSPDVQELKRVMEAVPDNDMDDELNDSALLEIWSTPPEYLEFFLDLDKNLTTKRIFFAGGGFLIQNSYQWTWWFVFPGNAVKTKCRQCSEAAVREPSAEGVKLIDEKIIAEALGVQLLQFVLLMKLELQDATDTLDVFLWRDGESFFGVSAEDIAANQEAQNSICQTMDSLCPPGGRTGERPWLDLCLTAYRAEDNGRRDQTCYQICDTIITKHPSTRSDPDPA
ncbi:protection of telomeres protein 1-like [Micropterus dolomieu]|uniref:protection of telomeres protein 1-like n=1 Tax=Micropterus dolomieu TaxID=147949 RepID=UPI001E8EEA0D|nr:protection of telomeres protein 1-like [Micropterus dolomieu]